MRTISELVEAARTHPDCEVHPPHGLPSVRDGDSAPADLQEFYRLCGGLKLFVGADYPMEVVAPTELVRANPVILGEEHPDDPTDTWYIVARGGAEEAITIDLSESRNGRCHDSFWDRHGLAGDCPIVARSFNELLEHLLSNAGRYWYWLDDGFEGYGDAYDR